MIFRELSLLRLTLLFPLILHAMNSSWNVHQNLRRFPSKNSNRGPLNSWSARKLYCNIIYLNYCKQTCFRFQVYWIPQASNRYLNWTMLHYCAMTFTFLLMLVTSLSLFGRDSILNGTNSWVRWSKLYQWRGRKGLLSLFLLIFLDINSSLKLLHNIGALLLVYCYVVVCRVTESATWTRWNF